MEKSISLQEAIDRDFPKGTKRREDFEKAVLTELGQKCRHYPCQDKTGDLYCNYPSCDDFELCRNETI